MSITVNNVSKSFGNTSILHNINFEIKTGEIVSIVGPSGSGKTTLLRVIAGLESPDSGSIFLEGQNSVDKPAKDRNIGFVFQHYALFKHMSVYKNIAFGLEVNKKHGMTKEQIQNKVFELLKLVRLEEFAQRYPNQLSGGQRQRVAIARSLAVAPKTLLLDEPFGALDTKVRKELRQWMRKLHTQSNITSILVTHDHNEAMEISDRIIVMNGGRIEQIGTPREISHSPQTPFIYDFFNIEDVTI